MVPKSSYYHIVIEVNDTLNNKYVLPREVLDYLKGNEAIIFFAFILHDLDYDDMGVKERNHYHLHIQLCNSYSKNTVINDIASKLLINRNCISCRQVKDVVKSVQYLVHLNDKDKASYDVTEIWSNDYTEVMTILSEGVSSYDIDIDYLIDLVRGCRYLYQVYRHLGIKKAMRYRTLITDIWKEKNTL